MMPTCLSCNWQGAENGLERIIAVVHNKTVTIKRCPKCASELIDYEDKPVATVTPPLETMKPEIQAAIKDIAVKAGDMIKKKPGTKPTKPKTTKLL